MSVLLTNMGYQTIGMDISVKLLNNAKIACKDGNFFACDAEFLPIRKNVINYVLGISILHHLKISTCVEEIKRVTQKKSYFLFEEPNILNPFSAFGRKFFPMETHTIGEKQFYLPYLIYYFRQNNISVLQIKYLFFLTFPLSRFFKLFNIKIPIIFVNFYYYLETLFEKSFPINRLNASIILLGLFKK